MNFVCTLNHRLSKVFEGKPTRWRERDGAKEEGMEKKGDKNKSEKGSLIGGSHRPCSCPSPCFFLSILPSSAPSLPPSAGNRALFQRGGDEEIKRKLHRVLLFDKKREVESRGNFKQLLKRRGRVGEKGWTREGQTDTGREKTEKAIWDLRS